MSKADHEIIQGILDGTATEIEFHRFQQRMRQDMALRGLYRDYAMLNHCLSEEFEGQRLRVLPSPAKPGSAWRPALLATAAAIAVAAGLTWMQRDHGTGTVAVGSTIPPAAITFSADAAWKIAGDAQPDDSQAKLAAGTTVQLQRGAATILVDPGVTGLIEAPAEIVYAGPKLVHLVDGRARFRVAAQGRGFTVRTRSIEAMDLGTEFAVFSRRDGADELHVFEGKVEMRVPDSPQPATVPVLVAGDAVAVSPAGAVTRMVAEPTAFRRAMPVELLVMQDSFKNCFGSLHGRVPAQGQGIWEVREGRAIMQGDAVGGRGFQAFCRLQGPGLGARQPILLATLELAAPADGPMHGPGWAGLSLFAGGIEYVFFGDSYGEEKTWSLDVRQGLKPLLPATMVVGPRTVTLRYDWRDGTTSLHDGPQPGGAVLVRGHIPAGLAIDEVRLGCSPDAAIMARALSVRILGAP